MQFNYQFGVPLAHQLEAARIDQRTTMPFLVMAPVRRQKRIVMDTHDGFEQPDVRGPRFRAQEILEGVDRVQAMQGLLEAPHAFFEGLFQVEVPIVCPA